MRSLPAVVVLLLGLSACGRGPDADDPGAEAAAPARPSQVLAGDEERRWQGVLPCRDCVGIDTRLQLSSRAGQQQFRLQEIYVGVDGGRSFERTGSWSEATRRIGKTDMPVVLLDPDGAAIAIRRLPDGTLEWLGPEGQPAADATQLRLTRQAY